MCKEKESGFVQIIKHSNTNLNKEKRINNSDIYILL